MLIRMLSNFHWDTKIYDQEKFLIDEFNQSQGDNPGGDGLCKYLNMLMRDHGDITKLTIAKKFQEPTLSRLRLIPTIAWTAFADPKDKSQ